jgi:hypothetical protein
VPQTGKSFSNHFPNDLKNLFFQGFIFLCFFHILTFVNIILYPFPAISLFSSPSVYWRRVYIVCNISWSVFAYKGSHLIFLSFICLKFVFLCPGLISTLPNILSPCYFKVKVTFFWDFYRCKETFTVAQHSVQKEFPHPLVWSYVKSSVVGISKDFVTFAK